MHDTTLVILGASGDLTRRLLMPSLYHLELAGKLPPLRITGYALEAWDDAKFREHVRVHVEKFAKTFDQAVWERFSSRLAYRSGDLQPASLAALKPLVPANALFYLALPPSVFAEAGEALGAAGLADEAHGYRRVVIEKPFGVDRKTARDLNARLTKAFREEQILRIDHFLGKESVQNLLVFRFANRFVEPIWNSNHVDAVMITVAETLGLEGRYKYYDQSGALRDMIQNHLMQLLALTAIEPPSVWDPELLRNHKVEVLQAIHPIAPDQVKSVAVRGRYARGRIGDEQVPGYLEEQGIPASSRTETFAAIKLHIDSWRWKGVPFYLRTGKRLTKDLTEVAVKLKHPPTRLFHEVGTMDLHSNWFVFTMKPEESIDILAQAKRPGLDLNDRSVTLHTPYHRDGEVEFSAYEQLLLDALESDRTHFLRFDEVDWAWKVLEPVLDAWKSGQPSEYPAGSEGPDEQQSLLEPGHRFRPLGA